MFSLGEGKANLVSNKPFQVDETTQIQGDDLKLICGIKEGIEKRLHTAEIQTYDQLASLTSQEILSKLGKSSGYSIRRIEEENWIGQAQQLIRKKGGHQPGKRETNGLAVRQHYENFTIEFLLDDKNLARRTHVAHVQSGDADTWAGWEADELFDFIARHAGLRSTQKKSTVPAPQKKDPMFVTSILTDQFPKRDTETVASQPLEVLPEKSDSLPSAIVPPSTPQTQSSVDTPLAGSPLQPLASTRDVTRPIPTIQLREWKISHPDSGQALHNLPHDQAFDVCLTLDLINAAFPERAQLDYTATLHAKKLGGGNRQVVGETRGTLSFEPILTLTIGHAALAAGLYRLQAFVSLRPAGGEIGQQSHLTAVLESGPVQVY